MVIDQKGNMGNCSRRSNGFSRRQHLGSIDTGTALANCKFGRKRERTIYCISELFMQVKVKVREWDFDLNRFTLIFIIKEIFDCGISFELYLCCPVLIF
jgi:hypothetical protein